VFWFRDKGKGEGKGGGCMKNKKRKRYTNLLFASLFLFLLSPQGCAGARERGEEEKEG
jgi:hypothetical protein